MPPTDASPACRSSLVVRGDALEETCRSTWSTRFRAEVEHPGRAPRRGDGRARRPPLRLRRTRGANPVKRVASAVGEGSMAIAFVHQFLALAPARAFAVASG